MSCDGSSLTHLRHKSTLSGTRTCRRHGHSRTDVVFCALFGLSGWGGSASAAVLGKRLFDDVAIQLIWRQEGQAVAVWLAERL